MPRKRRPDNIEDISIPTGMGPHAKSEFARIKPLLREIGYLAIDRSILIAYLQAYEIYTNSRMHVQEHGAVLEDGHAGRLYPNPHHVVMRQSAETVRKMAIELGMTTSTRRKLKISIATDLNSDDIFGGT